jgi:hypothetical protein
MENIGIQGIYCASMHRAANHGMDTHLIEFMCVHSIVGCVLDSILYSIAPKLPNVQGEIIARMDTLSKSRKYRADGLRPPT